MLENVPIENILILQDDKKALYICSLEADLLTEINKLGTIDRIVDGQSIKCLEVGRDLSDVGESEWRFTFDGFMSDILNRDTVVTEL